MFSRVEKMQTGRCAWKGTMTMRLKKFFLSAALGGLALLSADNARANSIIITNINAAHTTTYAATDGALLAPDTAGGVFNYRITLSLFNTLEDGDYFSIFDFSGYIPGTAMFMADPWMAQFTPGPSTFSGFTTASPVPTELSSIGLVATTDNPAVNDLTFIYHGGRVDSANNIGATHFGNEVLLGYVTAKSTLVTPRIDSYLARDHTAGGPPPGGDNPSENPGQLLVPGLPGGGELPLPLPSAAWGGMALIGLLGTKRFRRAKQA